MAHKVTVMVLKLKVDLQCSCCYKKIKKLLCKFPQIRDQKYDEKQNQVIITVVCCNPEKIRDELCCKGGKLIKSIEIKEPQDDKPPPDVKPPDVKPPDVKPPDVKPPDVKPPDVKPPPKRPEHVHVDVDVQFAPYPGRGCCGPCHGWHAPPPPHPCCDGYGYGYSYGKGCYVSKCDYYFREENPQGCTIM